jgi:hypothetical protein
VQLRYGFVGADFSDFHPASDRVTGPNWSNEVPIDIQKDSSVPAISATAALRIGLVMRLDNDLSESGGARRLRVVAAQGTYERGLLT